MLQLLVGQSGFETIWQYSYELCYIQAIEHVYTLSQALRCHISRIMRIDASKSHDYAMSQCADKSA